MVSLGGDIDISRSNYASGFNQNFVCSYFNDNSRDFDSQMNSLFVINLNIQGLLAKKDKLLAFIQSLASNYKLPDVIVLQETWLNN